MIFLSKEKIQIKKLQLSSANQITPFWSDFSSESKLTTANDQKLLQGPQLLLTHTSPNVIPVTDDQSQKSQKTLPTYSNNLLE
jgi:hypothetical protein